MRHGNLLQEKQPCYFPRSLFPLCSCFPLTDTTELILNHHGHCSPASSLPSLSKSRRHPSSPHLDLPIVTNSLDGDRALHKVLRVPGPELNDGFGPSHQAGNGAFRLNELLLLILAERRMKDGLLEAGATLGSKGLNKHIRRILLP